MPLAATVAVRRMRACVATHTCGGAVVRPRAWRGAAAWFRTRMLATCGGGAPLLSAVHHLSSRRRPTTQQQQRLFFPASLLRRPTAPCVASPLGRPPTPRQRHRQRRDHTAAADASASSADKLRLAFFGIIFLPNLYCKSKRGRKLEVLEKKPAVSVELNEMEGRRMKLAEADELFGESRYQEAFDLLAKMNRADDAQVLWRQARLLYNLARRYAPEAKATSTTAWVAAAPSPSAAMHQQPNGLVLSAGDEDDADACGTPYCHAGPMMPPGPVAPPPPMPPEEEDTQPLPTTGERAMMLKDALGLVRRALDSDEGCAAAHKWYAVLLDAEAAAAPDGGFRLRAQRLRQVHHHLRRAVELDPRDPAALYMLGEWCETVSGLTWAQRLAAALVLGADAGPTCTLEDAARLLERAEAAAPRFYSANLLALGRVYLGLGREDLAVYYLRQAVQYPEQTDEDQAVRSEAKQMLTKLMTRAVVNAKAVASRAARLQERGGAVSAGGPFQLSETVATVLDNAPFLDPSVTLEEAFESGFQPPSTGEHIDEADNKTADMKTPTQGEVQQVKVVSVLQDEKKAEKESAKAQNKDEQSEEVKEGTKNASEQEVEVKVESEKVTTNEWEKEKEKDEDRSKQEEENQVTSSNEEEEQKKEPVGETNKDPSKEEEKESVEEWRRQACEL